MKVKRTILAFVAGAFCILSSLVSSVGANAADITIAYLTTTDGNTSVPVKRVIKNLSTNVSVSTIFTYSIYPSEDNPEGALNEPTEFQLSFDNVQPAYNEEYDSVVATAASAVDFAGTTYTMPGDYIYTITEMSSSDPNYSVDNTSSFNILISVRNIMETVDGQEYTEGEMVATVLSTVEDNADGEKKSAAVFGASEDVYTMFHISTGIGGNAGDLTHCFKYKLEIMSGGPLADGTTLDIDYDTADANICQGTANVVSVGDPTYIYLTHHQQAFIGIDTYSGMMEIPLGTQYRVTNEDDDDYSVTAGISYGGMGEYVEFGEGQERTTGIVDLRAPSDQGVSFSHTKTLSALTGVNLKSLPYIIAGCVSALGILFIVKSIVKTQKRRA